MHFTLIASLIIIRLLAGMLSGFLGVGGGVIMIPLMLILLGMNQHEAHHSHLEHQSSQCHQIQCHPV